MLSGVTHLPQFLGVRESNELRIVFHLEGSVKHWCSLVPVIMTFESYLMENVTNPL